MLSAGNARPLTPSPREFQLVAIEVEAEITGNVWKIERAVGDEVETEDVLLIIESMKMEIPVEAPCAGRVAELRVVEGQGIEEGDVLVILEN
jgi:acetyl-CoA carboxylase biotin carboxyl carrier protein